MHGGLRKGAGRKIKEIQKKAKTIYLDENEIKKIEELPLPKCKTFSQKCRTLINLGNKYLNQTYQNRDSEVTFVDLFCGLGGIRIGFEQALKEKGFTGKCVFSSDIKPSAIKAYMENFGENPKCDITKINPSNLPNFDFLLGGFPCQAFSKAGLGLGFEDTRGTLFFNIVEILDKKKPLGFILENVEGLTSHDGGKTFKIIINTLQNLGYNIQSKVLNSKDFGLAQSRNRIYIIGYRGNHLQELINFENSFSILNDIIDYAVKPVSSDFSKKLLSHYRIENTYGKAIKDKRGGKNNIHSWDIGLKGEVSKEQKELLEILLKQRRNKKWATVIGIKWMDGMPLTEKMISTFYNADNLKEMLEDLVKKGYLTYEHPKQLIGKKRIEDTSLEKGYNIVAGKLSFEFTKILSPFEVTPTLVATDVHKMAVPLHNGYRTLTVKEGLRLFGFPDNYNLEFLKKSEAFDLLGNTVCIPVIKAVSKKLLESHYESNKLI